SVGLRTAAAGRVPGASIKIVHPIPPPSPKKRLFAPSTPSSPALLFPREERDEWAVGPLAKPRLACLELRAPAVPPSPASALTRAQAVPPSPSSAMIRAPVVPPSPSVARGKNRGRLL
ncbi:unnamed protein product, partial [Polarella glacialis]